MSKPNMPLTSIILALILLFVTVNGVWAAMGARVEYILRFPHDVNRTVVGESRLLPRRRDRTQAVRDLLEEMILGSRLPQVARVIPRHVEIQAITMGHNTVYVDFSDHMLFDGDDTPLTFAEMIDYIHLTVKQNFPDIEAVVITVNGETL